MVTSRPRCFLAAAPAATQALAAALAERLAPGCLLRLEGDLGVGKTTFVQGLARGLGVAGPVQSPTFTLIRQHAGSGPMGLAHMDLYRLSGAAETRDLGLDAYLDGDEVVAVEWPDRAGEALPAVGLVVSLTVVAVDGAEAGGGGVAVGSPDGITAFAWEPPRLIRIRALDRLAGDALAGLVLSAMTGLDEISCPPTAADKAERHP